MAKIFWKLYLRMDSLAFPYHPLQFRSAFFAPLFEHIIFAMAVNDARGGHRLTDAEARRQAWIGNVPGGMTSDTVAMHWHRQGYGLAQCVLLNSGTGGPWGALQWGYVSFDTEE